MNEDAPLRERHLASSGGVDLVKQIRTTKVVYPQVYAYRLIGNGVDKYDGSQKIGYTERHDVEDRINEQTNTAAIRLNHQTLWHAPAFYDNSKSSFTDKDFHKYLDKSGIERRPELGTEWFYFDGTPERSKELFDSFRRDGMAGLQNQNGKTPYHLRPEQEAAVQQTLVYFQTHSDNDDTDEQPTFLWNAKPRFGKTLAAYDLAKRLDAKRVLIVTNRPAIANSWYDDFAKFIDGYYFISTADSLKSRPTLTREQYNDILDNDKRQITFLSLQDLKGSKYFGGNHEKLSWVHDLDWDLLIIDEAHEGVDTDRTDAAFDIIKRKYALYLSGTPFKALANAKFPADAIYNWTYLDEQKAKADELASGQDNGDHVNLPDLKLYTYRISEMAAADINEGIDIDGENYDYSFDLNEFFATNSKHEFVHEADVKAFLHNLTTNEKYPFSTPQLRNELKHTFWYVGNRVDSVKALAKLLNEDPVFKDYEIVIAAGDGKSFEEESDDYKANEKSFDRVQKAIVTHDKTITLSCGQLTTGVTIKQWSAVLMLTDITSPAIYMQAAFRAQNPYAWTETVDGQTIIHRKKSAYLFDFSPTRVLRIYDSFANALSPTAAVGEITEAERRDNIRELLNFFPVISEDRHGRMVELDAGQVLTFPNALAAAEVVKARFMSNLLFNSSIKNVFNLPKQAEDILNKMDVETNKRVADSKADLNLDRGRELQANTTKRINENQGVILGEKIYGNNIDRAVDLFEQSIVAEPTKAITGLATEVERHTEPVIAKLSETYHLTKAEVEEQRQQIKEKQKLIIDEYVSKDIQDRNPEQLKQDLRDSIETDLVHHEVEKQEQQKVETERKSKEEQVKEHLRAFTRTIPMCIMANHTGQTITIDNFDDVITDEDFEDLTNITKEEFAQLRDGFDYDDENGVRRHFGGVFDKYCFNAAIAEFVEKKNQLGKYWLNDQHDIFEWIPNQKNNQIFTPKRVVAMMIDDLEHERPDLFASTTSRFIDLYMKSGLYVTEIAKRLFRYTRHFYNSDDECIKHILENQVYGLAPTNILYNITLSTIFSGTDELNIKTDNIKQYDLLADAKDGTARQAVMALFNNSGDPMFKFDAVVGNPPYQDGNKQQVYCDFYLTGRQVGDIVCMIFPSAWQQPKNANGLSKLNKIDIKEDRQIVYIDNRHNVFKNIAGAEETNIVLWKKGNNNNLNGSQKIFENGKNPQIAHLSTKHTQDEKPSEIIQLALLVANRSDFQSMQSITSVRKPYGLSTDVIGNPGKYNLPNAFYDLRRNENDMRLYAKSGETYYLPHDYPLPKVTPSLNKFKVFIPYAWGNMSKNYLGGAYSDIIVARPCDICTETYQEQGCYDDVETAKKHAKYVMTKFARALLYMNKHSQHSTTSWGAVPVQDFTEPWWNESIESIDAHLMSKYNIPGDIVEFVNKNIQAKKISNIINF